MPLGLGVGVIVRLIDIVGVIVGVIDIVGVIVGVIEGVGGRFAAPIIVF